MGKPKPVLHFQNSNNAKPNPPGCTAILYTIESYSGILVMLHNKTNDPAPDTHAFWSPVNETWNAYLSLTYRTKERKNRQAGKAIYWLDGFNLLCKSETSFAIQLVYKAKNSCCCDYTERITTSRVRDDSCWKIFLPEQRKKTGEGFTFR